MAYENPPNQLLFERHPAAFTFGLTLLTCFLLASGMVIVQLLLPSMIAGPVEFILGMILLAVGFIGTTLTAFEAVEPPDDE